MTAGNSGSICRQRLKGEISVFLALSVTVIVSLLLSVLESARTQGSRTYLTIAANSAIDSLFSQYHTDLWEEYRLLGLEHYTYQQLADETEAFLKPYLEVSNSYPLKLKKTEVTDLRLLTEDDGEIFEKEVMDYMEYGIAGFLWELADFDLFSRQLTEGGAAGTVSEGYEGYAKEAVRLEASIETINTALKKQEEYCETAAHSLNEYDGDSFVHEADLAVDELEKIPGYVDNYCALADSMKEGLEKARAELEDELAEGRISRETYSCIDEDAAMYESYVFEEGERRQSIEALKGAASAGADQIGAVIESAEEVMEYIASREPEDEEDELDERSLWQPVISEFEDYEPVSLGVKYGIADKETELKLENIRTMLSGQLLSYVLPEGASPDNSVLKMSSKPSELIYSGNEADHMLLKEKMYMTQYISSVTDYFGRGSYDTDNEKTGSGKLETEYILYGRDNDTDNLSETVMALVGMRSGLNLIHIYSDHEKRNQARALAMSISGAMMLTPLTAVVCFMVMSVWAMAQAVCDVRDLLAGKKVPLIHSSKSFYLDIDGLLSIASGKLCDNDGLSDSKGLKYIDYLKLLLFVKCGTLTDYRCMDVIEMCLKEKRSDFSLSRMAQSASIRVEAEAGHVWTETPFLKNNGQIPGRYTLTVNTSYYY